MVPDQHDGDFLSGRQQLQPKGLRDRYQAMLRVGVQCMALLEGEPGLKAGQILVNSTLRILSFRVVVAASRVLAELVDPRDFTFPDILDKDLQVY